MSRYFLSTLKIEGFRGINNEGDPLVLKFKKDAVNSIFAANASGKSSTYEAICYAIKGQIPKLSALAAMDRPNDYYNNKFHSSNTAEIYLEFEPDDTSPNVEIIVKRLPDGSRQVSSPSGHADPELFLTSLDSETVLLDQKSFLKFVEDSPLQRGRTFSGLLGFGKLSEYRQALETLANAGNIESDFRLSLIQSKITERKSTLQRTTGLIRANYEKVLGVPPPEPIDETLVKSELTNALKQVGLLQPFFLNDDVGTVSFDNIRATVSKEEGGEKKKRLTLIIQEISSLETHLPLETDKASQDTIRNCLKSANTALQKTSGEDLHKLYESAKVVLSSDNWENKNICPLCENDDGTSILKRVEENLSNYSDVKTNIDKIREEWKSADWTKRIQTLENSPQLLVKDETKEYIKLNSTFSSKIPSESDLDKAIETLNTLESARLNKITELKAEKESIEKELPPSLVSLTEKVEATEQVVKSLSDYTKDVSGLKKLEEMLPYMQRWRNFIEGASQDFANAEARLSTIATTSLQTNYTKMYNDITRNSDVVPDLEKASGTEKLFLKLQKFYGLTNVSANTLLSESYRNAFAVSIFLNAAKNSKSNSRFIVLDDVTSSFDSGHQYNLMEILRTQIANPSDPNGPQVIILSHDGLLEKYFDTLSNKGNWYHQKLQGLPPTGKVLSNAQGANRVRTSAVGFLNSGLKDQAKPLLRQYLEFKLLEIIRRLNISVPLDFSIRDDRKMVGNALTAIENAVNLHKDAGRLILDSTVTTTLQAVLVPQIMSNWLNHYNSGTLNTLTPHVLLGVLDDIDKVAGSFMYDCSCNGNVKRRYFKDLTQKHCSC